MRLSLAMRVLPPQCTKEMILSLAEEHTMSNKVPVGLRDLRRLSGWTQSRAARASSINHARISMAENCEIQLNAEEELRLRRVLLAEIRTRADRIERVLAETQTEMALAKA
jgi:hypothetical protein